MALHVADEVDGAALPWAAGGPLDRGLRAPVVVWTAS